MSLREEIDQAEDLPLCPITVPEWGNKTVYIKSLTGGERLEVEKDWSKDAKVDGPAMCRLVVRTLADADGNLLYEYPKDIPVLNKKSAKAINRLFDFSLRVNAIEKKDVEELVKN